VLLAVASTATYLSALVHAPSSVTPRMAAARSLQPAVPLASRPLESHGWATGAVQPKRTTGPSPHDALPTATASAAATVTVAIVAFAAYVQLRPSAAPAPDSGLRFGCLVVTTGRALGTVLVAGATGRTGKLVVEQLLERSPSTRVRALVRDPSKAAEALPASDNVEVAVGDAADAAALRAACEGVDAVIWCATPFSTPALTPWETLLQAVGVKTEKNPVPVDREAMEVLTEALASSGGGGAGGAGQYPRVVMCSSAAVTRTIWSEEKKRRLVGAADIPIVRLNPFGILDIKRETEQVLRDSGVPYAIVRPTGLDSQQAGGRPIFTQGDVAVGRIARGDVAEVLVRVLLEGSAAVGKTFEVMTVPGLPSPRTFTPQLARLRPDARGLDEDAVTAQYVVLQQLLPGELMEANALAMGQTYEQLDRGETGRLGRRGEEAVPDIETFAGVS